MRKTIFRLALITFAVLLVAVCCPITAQPALLQAVQWASITEVKKNGLPYI